MQKLTIIIIATLFVLSTEKLYSTDTTSHRVIDSVVVTTNRHLLKRTLVPNSINIINASKLEPSVNSALLPSLGKEVPGLFVTQKGVTGFGVSEGSAGVVNIRGIGQGNKVLLMMDGQPQFAGIFGHSLPDIYVASDAERVEVVRGPGSLVYGSNAAAGVINVITHKQLEDGFRLKGRFMYGSYNTQKYLLSSGFAKGKFSGFVSVNHDKTDGHRENSGFRITNGYIKSSYKLSQNFKISGDFSIAKTVSQNPGESFKPIFENTMDILRGNGSISLENNTGKFSGALKGFYGFGDHYINDGYFEGGTPREMMFKSYDHNSGIMLYQSYIGNNGTTITVGADFKNWGGNASNVPVKNSSAVEVELVDKNVSEIAGYVIAQQEFFKVLNINAGLRYENNSIFGGEWVPQAGATLNLIKGNTIKYVFSKGFRSPNIREMFMFPPQNPDLLPERFFNNEVSILQTLWDGRLSAEVAFFLVTGENLIQIAFIDGKPRNVNTGIVNNRGFEVELSGEIAKNLYFSSNYSYLKMKNPVLAAPENMFNANIEYTPGKFRFNAGVQSISDLYIALGNSPVKESYAVVNASASYTGKINILRYTIFAKGDNLTGAKYSINLGFPMPGRVFSAGISIDI
jgi:iron complex outermembrane receptor protein